MQKEVTKKATGNIENNRFDIGNFEYNEGNDEFICPENKRMKFSYEGYEKERRRKYRIYTGTECQSGQCKESSVKYD
jgi:transposase